MPGCGNWDQKELDSASRLSTSTSTTFLGDPNKNCKHQHRKVHWCHYCQRGRHGSIYHRRAERRKRELFHSVHLSKSCHHAHANPGQTMATHGQDSQSTAPSDRPTVQNNSLLDTPFERRIDKRMAAYSNKFSAPGIISYPTDVDTDVLTRGICSELRVVNYYKDRQHIDIKSARNLESVESFIDDMEARAMIGDLLSSLFHRICVCFFLWLLYKQEHGKKSKEQGEGVETGKREPRKKAQENGRPRTADDTSNRSCYEQRLVSRRPSSSKEKSETSARTDVWVSPDRMGSLTSHFDIHLKLQTKFTRLWASSIITDPRTGDMSPLETDSREKTKGRSLLASATSAVDDLRLTTFTLNSKQLRIVELALPILELRVGKKEMLFWTDDNLWKFVANFPGSSAVTNTSNQGQSTSQALPSSLEVGAEELPLRSNNPMLAAPKHMSPQRPKSTKVQAPKDPPLE
ncbi:hypothetical protein D6C78_09719 [Aureobasidium pullulans]|uniref:Uncharacterized protein n=1 Tax=Aureobasidium pullulans TaxID=5580 RepID=A0A4V4LD85_AURPU|nr:hypothetical protein D6C78_09719 [Aureobasidium pullulans]